MTLKAVNEILRIVVKHGGTITVDEYDRLVMSADTYRDLMKFLGLEHYELKYPVVKVTFYEDDFGRLCHTYTNCK